MSQSSASTDAKDFPLVINARAESVAEKPSFRNAFKRRRCIFVADAFYEWRRPAEGKRSMGNEPEPIWLCSATTVTASQTMSWRTR